MIIKKIQQPASYPENQICDGYSENNNNVYNCGYINNKLKILPTNLVNGLAENSIKSANAREETENYYAIGKDAFALGEYTEASGVHSHAEGHYTTASGSTSHAEGYSTKAAGFTSHAEGCVTESLGEGSHAEGHYTKASSDGAHAEGLGTIASGANQHVQGKYNIANSNYAHIVGNGESEEARSNCHTIDFNGNAWFKGDVFVYSEGGTGQDGGSCRLQPTSQRVIELSPNVTHMQYPSALAIVEDGYYMPNNIVTIGGLNIQTAIIIYGLVTSGTTSLITMVKMPKSLKFIDDNIICNHLQVEARGIKGYLNDQPGFNEFANTSGYTITCRKVDDYTISMIVERSSTWGNTTNNTPIVLYGEATFVL